MARVRSSRPVSARAHTETPHQTTIPHDASPPTFKGRAALALVLAILAVLVAAALPAAAAAVYKPDSFQDVDFISKSIGFAVGTPGSLFVTTNGGKTWHQRPLGNTDWLTAVDFVSAKVGWVLGVYNEGVPARIWCTFDGGRHWVEQANPTDCDVLTDIKFTDKQTGIVVGRYGTILRTEDGGDSWLAMDSGTSDGLGAVDFPTAAAGYATAMSGRLLKTLDGGTSWTTLTTGVAEDLRGVRFVSASRGWVVGNDGRILTTKNGGASWKKQSSGTDKALAGVDFVSSKRGWAVGAAGTILRTTNGGAKWMKQKSGTTAFLFTVDFVTATRGFVVGERTRPPGSTPWGVGVIQRTVTGGKVWLKSF
jgi:photosystem II stability/assembly factor-like uncharacterized protein